MSPLVEHLIIMYLLISLVWFIISVILSITYGTSPIWLIIFVALTFFYIPVMLYFEHIGEVNRVRQGVDLTISVTIIWLVIQLFFAAYYLIDITA